MTVTVTVLAAYGTERCFPMQAEASRYAWYFFAVASGALLCYVGQACSRLARMSCFLVAYLSCICRLTQCVTAYSRCLHCRSMPSASWARGWLADCDTCCSKAY